MDNRELKGMQIAATMPLKRDAKGWIVPSQTNNGTYCVSPAFSTNYKVAQGIVPPPFGVQPWGCTCPDFSERHLPCKHVIAVELVVRREKIDLDGSVVIQEARITYVQNWPAYNAAQCAEGDMFPTMLRDLCSTLSHPYQGRGRPRLPLSDRAFAAISKVYSGRSARRHDSDVREAMRDGLTECDPAFNTVLRTLRDPDLTPILEELVRRSALPLAGVESDFAADGTAFSTCNYVRWFDHKWGKDQRKQEWVKLHAMTGVFTNVITDATVTDWRCHYSPQFIPMLNRTSQNFTMAEVSADKAYSSKANLQAIEKVGATPYVPFINYPSNLPLDPNAPTPGPEATAWERTRHQFAYNREAFLTHYHKRSNVETTFSMVKAKFGSSLKSKSYEGQVNEVLCKVVAHNIVVLISAIHELGLDVPQFDVGPQLRLAG